MNLRPLSLTPLLLFAAIAPGQTAHIKTRWTDKVSRTLPHSEYPRPQLVRKAWMNLNGQWEFGMGTTPTYDRKILVPFPVESMLSGITLNVGKNDHLWYRRAFNRPKGDRILLHFGASDFETRVSVNGKPVGHHVGGYDPFTLDITDALTERGAQELAVEVVDPTDSGNQPRGKQVHKPGGIFYTSTSGIWQTVWLEPVPKASIDSFLIETWPQASQANFTFKVRGPHAGLTAHVEAFDGSKQVAQASNTAGEPVTIKIPSAKLWSPESPFLYNLKLTLKGADDKTVDSANSYFAYREVSVKKDSAGITKIHLNGKPCFMVGPLDQGFWPDGIYTAPTDEALKYDIDVMRKLGFNMIRKHVKVEPDRWYYWCDRMGMLVWQDMPSGDGFIGPNDPDIKRSAASAAQYEKELKAMIDALRNHPSIVTWIPFNEGWGQFDTARITNLIKRYDSSRLVDSTTGWADRKVGDMIDWHVYPGPGSPRPEAHRAAVLGEFGGLGLPLPGHTWQKEGWGYRTYKDQSELTDAGVDLFSRLHLLVGSPGLSGAVYTQTSDVETEVNGLMTYDREIIKMDPARLGKAIRELQKPAPVLVDLVSTSQYHAQVWKFTTEKPIENWMNTDFNDSSWRESRGGFGTMQTPGAVVGTNWNTADIWLRKSIHLPSIKKGKNVFLDMHHDDDVEVYLDGKLIFKSGGYTSSYNLFSLPQSVRATLSEGNHELAVHCHQISGGQFIDVGLKSEQ